jgi:hypothetical protein
MYPPCWVYHRAAVSRFSPTFAGAPLSKSLAWMPESHHSWGKERACFALPSPVEMLRLALQDQGVGTRVAHRPEMPAVVPDLSHSHQEIDGGRVRAGDHVPGGAVPLLRQRLVVGAGILGFANRPGVLAVAGYPVQEVSQLRIGTGDRSPG